MWKFGCMGLEKAILLPVQFLSPILYESNLGNPINFL